MTIKAEEAQNEQEFFTSNLNGGVNSNTPAGASSNKSGGGSAADMLNNMFNSSKKDKDGFLDPK